MIAAAAHAEQSARRGRTSMIHCTRVGVLFALALCLAPASRTALAAAEEANATRLPARNAAIRDKNVVKRRALVETNFGREGDPRKVQRVVTIRTSDAMRYFPDQFRVKKGHTVRLLVHNGGRVHHDLLLGTMDDLKMHAALARDAGKTPHEGPTFTRVAPGRTGRIDWHCTKAGEFYYGCLRPGHFDAGMIGTIIVR
jgi:uncharacterized cupredoxin-like copper-binding protein